MAKFSVNAGKYANHLHGVALGGVTGNTEDPFYPWSNLARAYALEPGRPGRFATPPGPDEYVTIDKNRVELSGAEGLAVGPLVSNPQAWVLDLEDPGDPAGTVEVVSSPVKNGTRAFKLAAVTGEAGVEAAAMYQDVQIRAGEAGTVAVWIRSDGTRTANVSATVLETGTVVLSATESGATYALKTADFTAPAYSKQKPDGLWTLRVRVWITDAAVGEIFMDDFVYWPHTDTAAMIGHNVMPVISAFQLRRSTDNFVANDVLDTAFASPLYAPNFFALLGGTRTERYWRFKTTGTNPPAPFGRPDLGAIWFGQPWLLQRHEFDRSPNFGFEDRRRRDYKQHKSTGGLIQRYMKEDTRRVDLAFTWRHPDEFDLDELLERVFERGRYGEGPALIIRSTEKPTSAHMVWMPGDYVTNFIESVDARDVPEMIFEGCAYPTFTP